MNLKTRWEGWHPCPCWKHDLSAVLAGVLIAAVVILLHWWLS